MSTSTALGAEKAKEIIFISDAHEKFYYEKLKEVRYQDVYHKALVYCLGISIDTRRNVNRIYNDCMPSLGMITIIALMQSKARRCWGMSSRKGNSADKIKLEKFDDLFGDAGQEDSSVEKIINAPLTELYTFKDHPFRVVDDEKMEETTESEHFTTPPKHFTEDSLLAAMERAGAEDIGADAERKGLGTPATRADIIEKLVRDGFVKREKEQIVPTQGY